MTDATAADASAATTMTAAAGAVTAAAAAMAVEQTGFGRRGCGEGHNRCTSKQESTHTHLLEHRNSDVNTLEP